MKIVRLRINHAVLRYDHVPNDVPPGLFYRTALSDRSYIFSKDFFWKRSITAERFDSFLSRDLIPQFMDEMSRMKCLGLMPVLHVDYVSRGNGVFWVSLNSANVRQLVKSGSGIDICIRANGSEYVAGLGVESLSRLKRFGFTVEMA